MDINKDKIALLVCLDSNNKKNLYEYEFFKSIQSWINNSLYLNTIDIYVFLQKNTKLLLKTYQFINCHKNIHVIKYDNNFEYLFVNTLYCQYLFEQNYSDKYEFSIYIDLDLYLKKPLPVQLFCNKTIIPYYNNNYVVNDPISFMHRKIFDLNHKIHMVNTYFIINYLKNNLFNKLYQLLLDSEYNHFFNTHYLYKNDAYFFEECIYDYAQYKNILNSNNCRFIDTQIISENNNSFFKHYHIFL